MIVLTVSGSGMITTPDGSQHQTSGNLVVENHNGLKSGRGTLTLDMHTAMDIIHARQPIGLILKRVKATILLTEISGDRATFITSGVVAEI